MAYIYDCAGGIFCVTGRRRQEENRSAELDFFFTNHNKCVILMIRIKKDGETMDYIVNDQERSYLIETQKNKIKNQVIDQYIAIRKEKGLSQEKIANLTGIARTNIIRIEAKRNVPTIEVLAKLAEALDMELEVRFVQKRESADAE